MNETAGDLSGIVIWGAFALAFVFGAIANRTNFCTMGALSDVVNMGHWGRLRMWLLAIAVAMLGSSLLVLHRPGRSGQGDRRCGPTCPGCRWRSAACCSASA